MGRLASAIKEKLRPTKFYNLAFYQFKMIRRLVTRGVYMTWSNLVIDEKKVAYIVVQKVASTAIKASMIGMETDKDYLSVNRDIRKSSYVRHDLDDIKGKGYFVFTFVRNPFERLISCYENKYHTDVGLREGRIFDYYLMGYLRRDDGFRAFARRVCRIPDRLSDFHFISQSFLIDRMGRYPKPDYVGHFERLAEEYEPIRERFGFMPLPHHNKTPKKQMWMDYYDIPTAKMVYKRYREDIERYGYQETYRQLLAHLENAKCPQAEGRDA